MFVKVKKSKKLKLIKRRIIMKDCIFCKIAAGIVPSEFVYEDENFFIIKDIHPKAKHHFLAIPRNHYSVLADANELDLKILGDILGKIQTFSEELHLGGGYRLVVNQGENGGQESPHLHIHILSGEKLKNLAL